MNPLNGTLNWADKGIWSPHEEITEAEFLASQPHLFDGTCSWPVMVVREDALTHNIDLLAEFCAAHSLDFAPHGKTCMAPGIYDRQLAAGAWGITFATAQQVLVGRHFGLKRILLANELLDETAIEWLALELKADPQFEFVCYVDSDLGVRTIAEIGVKHGLENGFPVLIDIGYAGGRTGVRATQDIYNLAEVVAATDGIRLVGVSAYEGSLASLDAVGGYFATVREVVAELAKRALLPKRPIVTAGGSAFFDIVAESFTKEWAERFNVRFILRSGAYVSHDHGAYKIKTPYNRMPGNDTLYPAIEVWAQVLSAPELDLAIVGMGKRDAPYDLGMPVPLRIRRKGSAEQGIVVSASLAKMDDHHGYLELSDGFRVAPGDLICFGISHPCTAFDKWRQLPVVDENYIITDVLQTYF